MATALSIHYSYVVVRPLYPQPYLALVSADIFQLALSTAAILMTINCGESRAFRDPTTCMKGHTRARGCPQANNMFKWRCHSVGNGSAG